MPKIFLGILGISRVCLLTHELAWRILLGSKEDVGTTGNDALKYLKTSIEPAWHHVIPSNRPQPERPTHKELSKKLREARGLVELTKWLPADPAPGGGGITRHFSSA